MSNKDLVFWGIWCIAASAVYTTNADSSTHDMILGISSGAAGVLWGVIWFEIRRRYLQKKGKKEDSNG